MALSTAGVSGIDSMLQQMRAVVQAVQGDGIASSASNPVAGGFAAELQRSIKRVSDAQNAATAQAKAFELGDPGISLNDVIIDMQKASIGFQTAVQVRNRLVNAYKEISSMSV